MSADAGGRVDAAGPVEAAGASGGAAAAAEARLPVRVAGVALFALLTAVGARIAVPLPGTPVPFTLQVLPVLLSGLLLGARAGAASQATYLLAGVAGLPVFAAGGGAAYLLGPTGGYLLAFPVAAAVAGVLGRRGGLPWLVAGAFAGLAAVHAGGLAWLAGVAGGEVAFRVGVLPFLPGDALELLLVVLLARALRGPATRAFGTGG